MALTLGNWIALIVIVIVLGGLISFAVYEMSYDNEGLKAIIAFGAIFIFGIILAIFLNWYNTKTASGIRAYKDYESEMANGIEREITITAEDGREIFYYEGKVDIESNHEDNYIKFESEEGKRYIIYYGIQDTIQIIEK